MFYTISQNEIGKLAQARAAQVLRAQRDECGGLSTVAHVAPVEWRNGRVDIRPLRIDLLAKWASLLPAGQNIGVEMKETSILFLAGASRMELKDVPIQIGHETQPPADCVKYYGDALLLEAPSGRQANHGSDECQFICKAEIGDLKALKTAKADKSRMGKLIKLETALDKARNVHVTLSALLVSDRDLITKADLPAAVLTAKIIRDQKRKARRFTRQLVAFFEGKSNFPLFDQVFLPSEINAQVIADLATIAKINGKKEKFPNDSNWRGVKARRSRLENLRRKIVQLVTPAVAETLNVAGICSAGASVPGESRRNINNEPRIYIHREWEGAMHELTNARRHVRTLPAQIYWKNEEIEKLEFQIAKIKKQNTTN